MAGLIVLLNGLPGVGKLSVARLLAAECGLRLLDNHTLLNPAEAVLDRDDPLYWSLRAGVRALVIEALGRQAGPLRLVMTDALAEGDPLDESRFAEVLSLARSRGARLLTAVLECSFEENARRLVAPGRREQLKLTDVTILKRFRDSSQRLKPRDGELLEIDVTHLKPYEVASSIKRIIGRRPPATPSMRALSGQGNRHDP